jgi:hypothetical protein
VRDQVSHPYKATHNLCYQSYSLFLAIVTPSWRSPVRGQSLLKVVRDISMTWECWSVTSASGGLLNYRFASDGILDHLLLWSCVSMCMHEGVSKSFRTESITKYTLTKINTRWDATQRVMAAKLTRLTHKIAIELHLVAESWTICSSYSRRPVR